MIKNNNTISIIGRTNVGKSTLFNILNNKNISIVTHKKNTTIRCIENTYNTINLLDTPGPIIKHTNLKYNINKLIYNSIKISKILIIIIEQTKLKSEDFFLLELIKKYKKPKILIINKIDKINKKNILLPFINKIKNITSFTDIIPTSNTKRQNIIKINEKLIKLTKNHNKIKNKKHFTESKHNLITDITRESLLIYLNNELPYVTKIKLKKQDKNICTNSLNLTLIIKKTSHKKIIIGKNGKTITYIIKHIKKKLIHIDKKMKNINIKINIQNNS